MVPALLMHRPHMRVQAARRPEGSGALGALVVPALLMHRPHMLSQIARALERSGAGRTRLCVRRGALARYGALLSRHDRVL